MTTVSFKSIEMYSIANALKSYCENTMSHWQDIYAKIFKEIMEKFRKATRKYQNKKFFKDYENYYRRLRGEEEI